MESLVIRADASTQMGSGHLMRCLALGQAWKDAGGEVIFITTCQNEGLLQRLGQEGFTLHALAAPHPDLADWDSTMGIINTHPHAWLVLDGYHFDEVYQQRVKEAGHRLLVIDDMAHLKHYYADIILNQNLGSEKLCYSGEPDTCLLLGSRYVLLRREFFKWREWQREIPEVAQRVLVTLGGSDPDNITLKVIQALQKVDIPDLEATVVIGASNPHADTLETAVRKSKVPIGLICDTKNMPELMAQADVAISTAGITIWELLFLGTPSLIVILTDNQCYPAEQIDSQGAGKTMGWVESLSVEPLAREITSLLKDYDLRAKIRKNAKQIVDGRGSQRVLTFMQQKVGHKLKLRPVTLADYRLLWEWANDPLVRAVSFSSKPISWEDHVKWFGTQLSNLRCYYYILVGDNSAPIGQVRFNTSNGEAEINISISANFRGHGYGAEAIGMASKHLFQEASITRIYAHIKRGNTASINTFTKAGYKMAGTKIVKGHKASEMVLDKNKGGGSLKMNPIRIGSQYIGPGYATYIVAEISANHHQQYDEAAKLIQAAREAGADAVKLQTYTPDTLTIQSNKPEFRIGGGTPWNGKTLYELYTEAYMPWEWQPELKKIADDLGITLFSTPYDKTAVDFLEGMAVPAYKVASFEIVDIPLIEYIAGRGKPIIISTGMATLDEIDEAMKAARGAGASQIALLKCTSAYPAPPEEMNIRTIPGLAERFRLPVGLSDHTLDTGIPVAAVALGACIIEKHLTLSRSVPSLDSAFSLEPAEFKSMVAAIRVAEKALGEVRYEANGQEASSRSLRRSLFVVRNMKAGEIFTEENVRSIRPGYGLHPRHLKEIMGKRATCDIHKGTPLSWDLIT